MNKYQIITDSTCDITQEMADDLGLQVIPLSFVMDGKTYHGTLDGDELPTPEFYARIRAGSSSTTAQVSSEEFISRFEAVLQDGRDVLYIAFSSGLSSTCQSAMVARKKLMEKYPDRRIEVFDSLCASMGEGLFVYYAAKHWKGGADMDEVIKWMGDNVMKLAHWFTVDDLNHLKRGGRVSTATAVLGTMLGIKPVMHVDNEGHLVPFTKVRGRKQSLDALVKKMEDTVIAPKNQTVFISHGDALEDAEYVKRQVQKKIGVKEVYINYIGPIIGAHSGPGTIALFFLASER